jgi:hypothetical protein
MEYLSLSRSCPERGYRSAPRDVARAVGQKKAMKAAVLLALTVVPFLTSSAGNAQHFNGVNVSTVSHGVRLTLTMNRRAYPWQAIALVTVRVENLARGMLVLDSRAQCVGQNPRVVVWTRANHVVFPPAISPLIAPQPCLVNSSDSGGALPPSLTGVRLAPGAHREWDSYVILGGQRVRAAVALSRFAPAGAEGHYNIFTPFILVRITSGVRPVVHFCQAVLCAMVTPAARTQSEGPLLFASVSGYTDAQGRIVSCSQETSLRASSVRTLYPGCPQATIWHAVAGYLNQPVAAIHVGATSGSS